MTLLKRMPDTANEIRQTDTNTLIEITSETTGKKTNPTSEKAEELLQLPRKKAKGGRPPKGVKRNVLMVVRLTPSEKIVIDGRARKAGITPSEWFRKAAKTAQVVPRLLPTDLAWLKMLSGMANNLNQLTKLAHTSGLLTLASQCRALFTQVEELLLKLFKDDRKNMTGRSFGGCLRYVLNRKEASILESQGVRDSSTEAMIRDFNIQRWLNPNLGKAVGHLVLSWHQLDQSKLSPQVMADRAREYMGLMEIRDTQYAVVQHTDKDNPHVHVVYNRIDNNGKTITDQNNYKRNEKACKALTEKYGYYFGKSKEQVNRDRLKGKEQLRYQLFDAISAAAKTARSWQQLEAVLKQKGIGIEYKYKSGSTTEVQGISFSKERLKLKGSAIDRALSYTNLDKQLRQNSNEVQQHIYIPNGHSPVTPINQKTEEPRPKGQSSQQEQMTNQPNTGTKGIATEIETTFFNGEPGAAAPTSPSPTGTAAEGSETQAQTQNEQFSWLGSLKELSNAFGNAHDVDDDAMRRKRRSRSR